MSLLKNLLNFQQHQQDADEKRRADVYRSLMHWEAQIGGELFGPVPQGTRREFFCLDEKTWVWHEEWTDSDGRHALTTRYDIRPNGILKSQGTSEYQALTYEEAHNLYNAIVLYTQKVLPELDRMRNLKK
jgi:hypothetical protein